MRENKFSQSIFLSTKQLQFGLLLVSNYGGQSFTAYSIDNKSGSFKDLVYHEEYTNQVNNLYQLTYVTYNIAHVHTCVDSCPLCLMLVGCCEY